MRRHDATPVKPGSARVSAFAALLVACASAGVSAGPARSPADSGTAPSAAVPLNGPSRKEPPPLDHEPLIGVLLARAPRVVIQLDSAASLEVDGHATSVGPGAVTVEAAGGG